MIAATESHDFVRCSSRACGKVENAFLSVFHFSIGPFLKLASERLGGGRRIAGVATPLEVCNGEYDTDYSEKDRAHSPGIGQQSDSKGRNAGDKEP